MRATRVIAVGIAALAAAVQPLGPTSYANFGSTACGGSPRNCVNVANNYQHAVRFSGLDEIPGMATEVQWALTYVYNPTDLHAYRDDADPLPDVIVSDYNYGDSGVLGWVECPPDNTWESGTDPYRSCRGQKLRFNSYYWYYDTYFDTQTQRRKRSCHELGHTVGLRHWNQYHTGNGSCMYTPSQDSSIEGLAQHDRDHINSYYS
jgi:hypothetical protein